MKTTDSTFLDELSFYKSRTSKSVFIIAGTLIVLMLVEYLTVFENKPNLLALLKYIFWLQILLLITGAILARKIEYARIYYIQQLLLIFLMLSSIILFGILFANLSFLNWNPVSNFIYLAVLIIPFIAGFYYEQYHYIKKKHIINNIYINEDGTALVDAFALDKIHKRQQKERKINWYALFAITFVLMFILLKFNRHLQQTSSGPYKTPLVYISVIGIYVGIVLLVFTVAGNILQYHSMRRWEKESNKTLYTRFLDIIKEEDTINEMRKENGLFPVKVKGITYFGHVDK